MPEGVGPGGVRLQQGEGREVSLGRLGPTHAHQGQVSGLRRRALLSPGLESAHSCCGPGAPPETGGKPSTRESSAACLSASLNHAGFSAPLAKC